MKITIKSIIEEDFQNNLVVLNQQDSSIKKMVAVVEKQATNPVLNEYTVQEVKGKDFLFGKLFVITIAQSSQNYTAYVYHDQSSEEVLLLNWGKEGKMAGCTDYDDLGKCIQCVEGYTPLNDMCTYGCGVLCKTIDF